jgi:hypothetical protein
MGKALQSAITPARGDTCLTVRLPWAWLLVHGPPYKPVENRTWRTAYRGQLWVHAAATFDPDDCAHVRSLGIPLPADDDLSSGILGAVTLTACLPIDELPEPLNGHWCVEGPFCWLVSDPILLPEPIRCKGRLGLWRFRQAA